MIITEIVKLDKKKSKIISDEGVLFALYFSEIRKFSIKEGCELSDKDYLFIKNDVLFSRAKERALHLLESSEKTKYQITQKLRDGYYPMDIIERVIAFLEMYGLVDDSRYCNLYINTYSSSKSLKIIQLELIKKGIDKNIVESILSEKENIDETPQIIKLLIKKKYMEVKDDYKQKNKIIGYLLRRGYDYDSVLCAINILINENS